jgi:hypothetical protein
MPWDTVNLLLMKQENDETFQLGLSLHIPLPCVMKEFGLCSLNRHAFLPVRSRNLMG